MHTITTCQTTLTGKIECLQMAMGLVQKDIAKFRTRLSEVEHRVGDSEDVLHDHIVTLQTLKMKVRALESQAEDAEHQNQRNNLPIVGLPEGEKAADPTAFTERLLRSLLPQAQFSAQFVVERPHRMPATCGPPGALPHTFIL